MRHRTLKQDTRKQCTKWVQERTFTRPRASCHVLHVFLDCTLTLTGKARTTAHNQIKTHCHICIAAAGNHIRAQQSCQEALVPFAFLSAISGTFNFLFKVLFTFPSWYLFAIGLKPIFSFRWYLPPTLRSNPKERDSGKVHRARGTASDKQDSHPHWCSFPRGLHMHLRWQHISRLQFKATGPNFHTELSPAHSPLLRESCLVSFPPLTYMLKFSGFTDLISCLGHGQKTLRVRFDKASSWHHWCATTCLSHKKYKSRMCQVWPLTHKCSHMCCKT